MKQSDIRARVRNYLYEQSTDPAQLWTDSQLNGWIVEELRRLPQEAVYAKEVWQATQVQNQLSYTLPDGTFEVEFLEINLGTTDVPDWVPVEGWSTYAGSLFLPFRPTKTYPMRIHIRKRFVTPTDDNTTLDIADDQSEVLVLGVVVRAVRAFLSYFADARNWDTVAKPDGVDLPKLQAWYRELKSDYERAIKVYKFYPRNRNIDLLG